MRIAPQNRTHLCTFPQIVAQLFVSFEILKHYRDHEKEGPFEYWLVTTGADSAPGINGGLSKREGNSQNANTIGVPSVDEYLKKVTAAGGKITQPKNAIPGVGWFAKFADTEGNKFGLMQNDPSAK